MNSERDKPIQQTACEELPHVGDSSGPDVSGSNSNAAGSDSCGLSRKQILSGAPALVDSMVGKELAGRYLVTEFLGTGAMGVVYKARHKLLNREVAVKALRQDIASDEVSRKRFESEALAAGSLTHPNLIAVHDCGFTAEGAPFLVMDLLEGESLSTVLRRETRLEPLRLISILKQICAGLHHAHSKGLVHRDLKPNNIMLLKYAGGRDLVKIVDFGIAKAVNADQDLTLAGQVFGTPYYMSPEQCQGQKLDGRSDIYALGCLTYRAMTGKPPFCGDTPVNTIVMHCKTEPAPIREDLLDSDALRALQPVVMKMLAKEPDQRYQTAEEVRAALDAIEREAITEQNSAAPGSSAEPSVQPVGELAAEGMQSIIHNATQALPNVSSARKSRIVLATIFGCLIPGMLIVAFIGTALFDHGKPASINAPTTANSSPSGASPASTSSAAASQPTGPALQTSGQESEEPSADGNQSMIQPKHRRVRHEEHHASHHKPGGIKAFFHKLFK